MDGKRFSLDVQSRVMAFCHEYNGRLPAYSFVPLTDDASRAKVMKSRRYFDSLDRWVLEDRAS